MSGNQQVPGGNSIAGLLVLLNTIIIREAYTGRDDMYVLLLITLPLLLLVARIQK